MRLPKKGEEFDAALINRMVDVFIDNGYSYFDTAYIYPGSEEALKESVVKRYPREMYQIATKLPIYPLDSPEKIKEIFNTSISRLGVEYIDYYLIHGIDMKQCEKAEILGAWSFISSLKEKGIVKHIGFSFLGTPEELEAILLRHPKAEFVQLQINYFDWDNDRVQSGRLYEIAVKFGKPIVIMEPEGRSSVE